MPYSSSRDVPKHQIKKHPQLCAKGKSLQNPNLFNRLQCPLRIEGNFPTLGQQRFYSHIKHAFYRTLERHTKQEGGMRKRSNLLFGMQGWQIQIVKWWHLVSKDKKLAVCKWMHLNPESRAIETQKHQITRVHDTQVYFLHTIQIAVQNEHGNVGGWNTPMQCERGEHLP